MLVPRLILRSAQTHLAAVATAAAALVVLLIILELCRGIVLVENKMETTM